MGQVISVVLGTVPTRSFVLIPLTSDVPGTEALVAWIVACEVAILLETLFLVSAHNEMNYFVIAHGGQLLRADWCLSCNNISIRISTSLRQHTEMCFWLRGTESVNVALLTLWLFSRLEMKSNG